MTKTDQTLELLRHLNVWKRGDVRVDHYEEWNVDSSCAQQNAFGRGLLRGKLPDDPLDAVIRDRTGTAEPPKLFKGRSLLVEADKCQ